MSDESKPFPPLPDFTTLTRPYPLAMELARKHLIEKYQAHSVALSGRVHSHRLVSFSELSGAMVDYVRASQEEITSFDTAQYRYETILRGLNDLMDWTHKHAQHNNSVMKTQINIQDSLISLLKMVGRLLPPSPDEEG